MKKRIPRFKTRLLWAGLYDDWHREFKTAQNAWATLPIPEKEALKEEIKQKWMRKLEEYEAQQTIENNESETRKARAIRKLSVDVDISLIASPQQTWHWATNHINVVPSKIDVARIPCRAALEVLARMVESEKFKDEILKNPTMMRESSKANKSGEEVDEHDADLIEMSSKLEGLLAQASPARDQREPNLPSKLTDGRGDG